MPAATTLHRQFLKFALAGAIGTSFHYATLIALVELAGVAPPIATAAGFLVGAVTNYLLSRRYVFDSARAHGVAAPRFLAVALVGAVLNSGIVWLLVSLGFHYLVGQVLATGAVLAVNFVANKYWTFA